MIVTFRSSTSPIQTNNWKDLTYGGGSFFAISANIGPDSTSVFSLSPNGDFWNQKAQDERNHAALLIQSRPFITLNDKFPDEIFPNDIEEIKNNNAKTIKSIDTFTKNPSREKSFKLALGIEPMSGELHYQSLMNKVYDT